MHFPKQGKNSIVNKSTTIAPFCHPIYDGLKCMKLQNLGGFALDPAGSRGGVGVGLTASY